MLKSKITPLLIDFEISLPFKNSPWIFKIRLSLTLVKVSVWWSGSVPQGWNFRSFLLFHLLVLFNFLRPPHPLPLSIISILPLCPPLQEIFISLFNQLIPIFIEQNSIIICYFFIFVASISSFSSHWFREFSWPVLFFWISNHTVIIGRFKIPTPFK